jgi:hypothetical protein
MTPTTPVLPILGDSSIASEGAQLLCHECRCTMLVAEKHGVRVQVMPPLGCFGFSKRCSTLYSPISATSPQVMLLLDWFGLR